MNILQAIEFELPRRRSGSRLWDDPAEFLMYMVCDVVATDWQVQFPNGRIIEEYDYALEYQQDIPGPRNILKLEKSNGSEGE